MSADASFTDRLMRATSSKKRPKLSNETLTEKNNSNGGDYEKLFPATAIAEVEQGRSDQRHDRRSMVEEMLGKPFFQCTMTILCQSTLPTESSV